MGDASKNFDWKEFECKDGCGLRAMDPALITIIQGVRDDCNFPLSINSGCRCAKHNAETPGSDPKSSHTPQADGLCHAADIGCSDAHDRWRIVSSAIHRGAKRIEICPTWVHISNDSFKPPEVMTVIGTFKL
jgi:zinc D-Ala-D-Ala carboxypeptidase